MNKYDPLDNLTNAFIIVNYILAITLLFIFIFFGWDDETKELAAIVCFCLIINLIGDLLFNKRNK